jgi:hypothetical protein
MKDKKSDLVWYACYGSNIDDTRFLKYVQGGSLTTIGETVKEYIRCDRDAAAPRKSKAFMLPYKLVFGKKSGTWGGHGVAFIGNTKNKRTRTFSRIYLISKIQFAHLFAQENGRDSVKIEFEKLDEYGRLDFDFNFYDRLVKVGKVEGHPVYTFTNSKKIVFNDPCKEYLTYIFTGILKTHKIKANQLADRFSKVKTGLSRNDLKQIIK